MKDVALDYENSVRTAAAIKGNDYVGRKLSNLTLLMVRHGGHLVGIATAVDWAVTGRTFGVSRASVRPRHSARRAGRLGG